MKTEIKDLRQQWIQCDGISIIFYHAPDSIFDVGLRYSLDTYRVFCYWGGHSIISEYSTFEDAISAVLCLHEIYRSSCHGNT